MGSRNPLPRPSPPDVAIVFHLKNHYALLFALREWTTRDGVRVRQLLTSRRGQKPKHWIDWEEARNIMIKWPGYKMQAHFETLQTAAAACARLQGCGLTRRLSLSPLAQDGHSERAARAAAVI